MSGFAGLVARDRRADFSLLVAFEMGFEACRVCGCLMRVDEGHFACTRCGSTEIERHGPAEEVSPE